LYEHGKRTLFVFVVVVVGGGGGGGEKVPERKCIEK
jgi:hypothetical protein